MRRLLFMTLTLILLTACGGDWRTASREPAGIAPDPAQTKEAVLQVYGAPTWGWRGWFAMHTWIAAKRTGETTYTVYELIGWRQHRGQPLVRIEEDIPDRLWYGEQPRVLSNHQGGDTDRLIDEVARAARSYPWPETYRSFPGPNSNTFTAWIAKEVPALNLDLPVSAIGSGYIN